MEDTQKQKLNELFAQEHVAVLVTQGEEWPTATMQAFCETPEMDFAFIVPENAEKFQNILKRPKVTVLLDTRDTGDVPTFRITRAVFQGVANEVPRDSQEWESLKAIFLKKNPFEAPFFGAPTLRMVRFKPTRVSYAGADRDTFKAEF